MEISSIVLSPEYVNTGRREAKSAQANTRTGCLVSLDASGQFAFSTAAGKRQYVTVENVSVAGGIDYIYAADENVFAQALPSGCRVALAAGTNAEYAAGSEVEIGNNGLIVALAAGVSVGVVVRTVTPAVGEQIAIDLF